MPVTFRDLLDRIYESPDDDLDLQAGIAIMQLLRTINQQEAATLNGCCTSLLEFIDQRGEINRVTLTRFLEDCKMIDLVIPKSILEMSISGDD